MGPEVQEEPTAVSAAPAPPDAGEVVERLVKQTYQNTLRQAPTVFVIREGWKRTEKQLRPKAWVEKWDDAPTEQDRDRIFARALKSHCIDLLRRRRWEERHFVSLDALAEQEHAEVDEAPRPRYPYPSYRENFDAPFIKEQFRKALLELPILLLESVRRRVMEGGELTFMVGAAPGSK